MQQDLNEYFNDEVEYNANKMLIELSVTGQCSKELITICYKLYNKLLNKSNYCNYDYHVKEDMVSKAIEWLLLYGRNYNPQKSKSKRPAYTFLTNSAESAFKRILVKHYEQINIEKLLSSSIEMLLNDNYGRIISQNYETFEIDKENE